MTSHMEPLGPAQVIDLCAPNLHFSPKHDQIKQLNRANVDAAGGETSYFTSLRGTGKSIELLRLRQLLRHDDEAHVFYADILEYLSETEPPDIIDFLIVLMTTSSDALQSTLGAEVGIASYLERVLSFLKSEWALERFGIKIAVGPGLAADLKLALKHNKPFR